MTVFDMISRLYVLNGVHLSALLFLAPLMPNFWLRPWLYLCLFFSWLCGVKAEMVGELGVEVENMVHWLIETSIGLVY